MSKLVFQPEEGSEFHHEFGFSAAAEAGGFLFISGQVGRSADGAIPTDATAQFEAAFENLGSVLELAGLGFKDIVDFTTYHVGLSEHAELFASVKSQYIPSPFPTWTAIGVSELAFPGLLVELKTIAKAKPTTL